MSLKMLASFQELESNWTLVKHVLKYAKRRDIHEDEFCIVSIFNCALIGQ